MGLEPTTTGSQPGALPTELRSPLYFLPNNFGEFCTKAGTPGRIQPATLGLEGRCSIRYGRIKIGRGGEIRTRHPAPKQAPPDALHPDSYRPEDRAQIILAAVIKVNNLFIFLIYVFSPLAKKVLIDCCL